MYPVSSTVMALFESENRQLLRITGTDKNGATISITDANVLQNGFNIDRFSCNGTKLEIGTATAAELTLKLDNRQGQFNNIVFEGAELYVEVGIADWSDDDPEVTYIPCGYFTCYEQPRNLATITIHALDRMMMLDINQPGLTPWTSSSGAQMTDYNGTPIYFAAALSFPATVANLIGQICYRVGLTFEQNISSFPNASYTVQSLPELQQPITCRNLIQWCAGLMSANAWIDWEGKLRFSWYDNSTSYVCTTANRFTSDLYEDDITFTGAQYTNMQGAVIVSGSADYCIDLTGNYLLTADANTLLPVIKNKVNGFSYRPFTATVINAPYLWPMDVITFTDKDGNDHSCVLTNVNFSINGTTVLSGKGETAQTNSGAAPNAMTAGQAYMVEATVKTLDNSLDQDSIFNRLTNNGETQGLLLYNGKVYLNASYINAGTMSANYLEANSITASKLAANSVTTDAIMAGAITTNKIAAQSVTTDRIATRAITSDRIAVGAITADMITAGTMSANRISGGTIDATNVTITNLNANNIKSGTISATNGNSSWNLSTGWFTTSGSDSSHDYTIELIDGQISISCDNSDVGLIDGKDNNLGISGPTVWIHDTNSNGQIYIGSSGIIFHGDLIAGDYVGSNNVGLDRSVTIGGTTLTFAQGLLVGVS